MKQFSRTPVLGMANLNPKKSGLPVIIWADHSGVSRSVSHNAPRVKIGDNNYWASVSISSEPEIFLMSKNIKKSEMHNIEIGMKYVARNYDLFLRHFNDTDFSFDDEDLYQSLRDRGEYK